ncbi:MAG: RHS repeat protein [Desulfamplus sp.]|nr:RHS repeat protein [Desulfamplus sp.]
MAKKLVVEGGTIELKPYPGWSWQGWNGIIELKGGQSTFKIDGKPVIIESDIAKFPYTPKQYTATVFSDIPGTISSVAFLSPTDPGTLSDHTFCKGKCLTDNTEGKFIATVGNPSMKIIPGTPPPPPVPDTIMLKTGTWKVKKCGQETWKEDKVSLVEPEEIHTLDLEYIFDDDTPVENLYYIAKLPDGSQREGFLDNLGLAKLENVPPGNVEVEFGDPKDEEELNQLREKLKNALDNMVNEVAENAKALHNELAQSDIVTQGMVYTGAFLAGLYEAGEGMVSTVVSIATAVDKIKDSAWQLVKDMDMDRLQKEMEELGASAEAAWDSLERGYDTLCTVMEDDQMRAMLTDFPERYLNAQSGVEITKMSGGLSFDIVLALCTAGAGAAAASASKSRYFTKASKLIDKISDVLKRVKFRKTKLKGSAGEKIKQITGKSKKTKLRKNKSVKSYEKKGVTTKSSKQGTPVNQSTTAGCPISMISGEELLQQTDFVLPGPLPLVWQRTYRSQHLIDHGLGYGWGFTAGECLHIHEDHIIFRDVEGRDIYCLMPEIGKSTIQAVEGLTIIRETDDSFRIRQDGVADRLFAPVNGRLSWPLRELTDPSGNRVSFLYKEQGHLSRIHASTGQKIIVENDPQGRISSLRYSEDMGQSDKPVYLVRYAYNEEGDLIRIYDANDYGESYQYTNHLIMQRTLKTGFSFYFEWDEQGRCIHNYGDDNIYDYHFEWDLERKWSKSIDSRGVAIEYRYNRFGKVTEEKDGEGNITRYEYDDAGRLTATFGPSGEVQRFIYDEQGRLEQTIDPKGQTQSYKYDQNGRLIEWVDLAGAVWKRKYDTNGQLIEATDPLGHTTTYRNNEQGLPIEIQDPAGNSRFFEWNREGRLISETDTLGNKTGYEYDRFGNIVRIVAPDNTETRYQYDALGNVTGFIDSAGGITTLEYNESGDLICYTDPAGRSTRYEYDGLSQVIKRINPDGTILNYEYDAERNLTTLINQNGEKSYFKYDNNEQLIEEVGFDGRIQRYEYDASGYLTGYFDGIRYTGFVRDPLGNLLEKQCHEGRTQTYQYDESGRLTEANNSDSQVRFTYDAAGNMLTEQHDDAIIRHQYNLLGLRERTDLPDNQVLEYRYDSEGELLEIYLNDQELTNIERDVLGRPVTFQQGGVSTLYDYDLSGRLQTQNIVNKDQRTLLSRKYDYDTAGNLASLTDSCKGTTRFHYDALDRLKAVQGMEQEIFSFDPAGNLHDPAQVPRCGYVVGNRLRIMGDRYFHYDDAGNLVKETQGRHGKTLVEYEYDSQNQLIKVIKGGQVFEYKYDALGRRISKKDAFGETLYLWNGNVLLSETRNNIHKTYIYEPVSFRPLAFVQDGRVYYYHLDHLGTPQEMTDEQGEIVWSVQYRAYGNVVTYEVEEVENNLRFQGQYFDEETGLHYNRFRYYDPKLGRFIHQDPIGLDGGENFYEYAKNPTGWIDPLGLCKNRLPITKGKWSGKPGEGLWYSKIDEVNEITGGKPIQFKGGRPDFSTWAKGSIKFEKGKLKGTSDDFDLIHQYIGKQKGISKTAAKNYLKEIGLTPHHLDKTTIQLVPTKLHSNIPHTGSAADLRRGLL